MAIDFPNSPANNDVFTVGNKSWVYEAALDVWSLQSSSALGANTVTTVEIASGAVTDVKIANSAVTTAKIENNAVTDAKIASTAAIKPTIMDAKGDLVVASANDTVSRLAVGATAGHVLTVDSTEALGVKWAAPAPAVLG